jgi:hypothetical protein
MSIGKATVVVRQSAPAASRGTQSRATSKILGERQIGAECIGVHPKQELAISGAIAKIHGRKDSIPSSERNIIL